MVSYISLFLISLLMCASSFRMLLQLIIYSVFVMLHSSSFRMMNLARAQIVYTYGLNNLAIRFVSEWSPYTFINVLASNHAINLINTGSYWHLLFCPGQVNNRKEMPGSELTLDLFKCWVKNHLQEIDARASVRMNTVSYE